MPSILLVDDDELFREMINEVLNRAGYEVQQASDGNQALRRYREHPADLVITDVVMPDKEGLEVITELRQADPQLKVIAMSGGGRNKALNYLVLARHLGAQRILAKPFSHAELLEAVEIVLNTP